MMYEFKFPDVGEGVHEGTILQIKIPIGQKIQAGDILAVVETDKVVAEIPSSKDGVVKKYGFEEGQVIEVGQTLAYIETEGDASQKEVVEENANVVGELDTGDGTILPSSGEGLSDSSHENASIRDESRKTKVMATPLARKIARDRGIDISSIKGTGPAGRVTKRDVLASSSHESVGVVNDSVEVVSTASSKTIAMSKLRQTIAANMTKSGQIPTATVHEEILFDGIVKLRKDLNNSRDYKISYLPIILKAFSLALKEVPEINSTYDEQKLEITQHAGHHFGVAIDKGTGLFVPVVKDVQLMTIDRIAGAIKGYVQKVEQNKLSIGEMRGGTISVSNYGTEGGIFGNPLILPPQAAIVGIGRIHQKPVVKDGEVTVGTVLPVSLVIDHRVLDGAIAGRFITIFRKLLENPHQLIAKMV